MQKYKVNIAEGVSQVVEARNPEEARQKVKAQIAKRFNIPPDALNAAC